jgi:hypothetical protein
MFNKLKSKQKILSRITFFITITIMLIGISAAVIYFAPISKAVSTTPRFTSLYTTGTGGGYQQGASVSIQWTIAEPVPYGEWFVGLYSSTGVYYDYTVLSAGNGSSSTSFSYNLPVSTAPVESGYRAVVAYRATSSDSWISVTSSSDTFAITAAGTSTTNTGGTISPPVTVTAPTLTSLTTTSSSNYKQGTNIGIQWRTASPVASGEWFVGLYSSSGVYYDYVISNVGIGGTSTAFSYTQLISTAPAGSGYRAVVAYRATASDSWTSVTSSSNTFAITAGTAPISTTPTMRSLVAAGSGSYEQQSVVTIQWTTAQPVASGEWFVGLYSSSGTYYDYVTTNTGVGTNTTSFSYTLAISTTTPIGSGYRAVIAYRANANSSWVNVTSSSNTFSIIASTATTTVQDKVEGNVVKNSLCWVDASNVPELLNKAKIMAADCKKYITEVETLLGKSTCPIPHKIYFSETYPEYQAYALGCDLYFTISNVKADKINSGVMSHELTHIVQNYGNKQPPYKLNEGMADYITHAVGARSGYGYCQAGTVYNSRFNTGYECGAVFLKYIENKYSAKIVRNINTTWKNGTYTDKVITNVSKTSTNPNGLTIEQLYKNCLNATNQTITCKGGAP